MNKPLPSRRHPGKPEGSDTVPAWLTPGEFVMNAEAARMFSSEIQAMNDRGRVVQKSQGGTIPQGSTEPIPTVPPPSNAYAEGGVARSLVSSSNGMQTSLIPRPHPDPKGENPKWIKELRDFEEYRTKVYMVRGVPHIGIGHKLPMEYAKRVGEELYTHNEIENLFKEDTRIAMDDARSNINNFDILPEEVQGALTHQAFQMGKGKQKKFKEMIKGFNDGDYKKAVFEVFSSNWAKPKIGTPKRANYLASAIQRNLIGPTSDPRGDGVIADPIPKEEEGMNNFSKGGKVSYLGSGSSWGDWVSGLIDSFNPFDDDEEYPTGYTQGVQRKEEQWGTPPVSSSTDAETLNNQMIQGMKNRAFRDQEPPIPKDDAPMDPDEFNRFNWEPKQKYISPERKEEFREREEQWGTPPNVNADLMEGDRFNQTGFTIPEPSYVSPSAKETFRKAEEQYGGGDQLQPVGEGMDSDEFNTGTYVPPVMREEITWPVIQDSATKDLEVPVIQEAPELKWGDPGYGTQQAKKGWDSVFGGDDDVTSKDDNNNSIDKVISEVAKGPEDSQGWFGPNGSIANWLNSKKAKDADELANENDDTVGAFKKVDWEMFSNMYKRMSKASHQNAIEGHSEKVIKLEKENAEILNKITKGNADGTLTPYDLKRFQKRIDDNHVKILSHQEKSRSIKARLDAGTTKEISELLERRKRTNDPAMLKAMDNTIDALGQSVTAISNNSDIYKGDDDGTIKDKININNDSVGTVTAVTKAANEAALNTATGTHLGAEFTQEDKKKYEEAQKIKEDKALALCNSTKAKEIPQGFIEQGKSALQEAWGELFDPKSLARAAILYCAGRLTGMSPNQAMGFAGKIYLNDIAAGAAKDKRLAHIKKLRSVGNYTEASLELYRVTGKTSDLMLKGGSPYMQTKETQLTYLTRATAKKLGLPQRLMLKGYSKGKGENKETGWLLPNGQPVDITNPDIFVQDHSLVPGSDLYIAKSDKLYDDFEKRITSFLETPQYMEVAKDKKGKKTDKMQSVFGHYNSGAAAQHLTNYALTHGLDKDTTMKIAEMALANAAAHKNKQTIFNIFGPDAEFMDSAFIQIRIGSSDAFVIEPGTSKKRTKYDDPVNITAVMTALRDTKKPNGDFVFEDANRGADLVEFSTKLMSVLPEDTSGAVSWPEWKKSFVNKGETGAYESDNDVYTIPDDLKKKGLTAELAKTVKQFHNDKTGQTGTAGYSEFLLFLLWKTQEASIFAARAAEITN